MSKIEQIEREIQGLTSEELTAFRKWFLEFDAVVWDRQIEADAQTGRLDTQGNKAIKDFKSGRCSEL